MNEYRLHRLFTEWKHSEACYTECLRFWNAFADYHISAQSVRESWTYFLGAHQGGAFVMFDDDIASRMDRSCSRAFILRLNDEYADCSSVTHAHLDMFGIGYLEKPIEVLTITFTSSIEAIQPIQQYMSLWLDKRTSYEDMLEQICPPTSTDCTSLESE